MSVEFRQNDPRKLKFESGDTSSGITDRISDNFCATIHDFELLAINSGVILNQLALKRYRKLCFVLGHGERHHITPRSLGGSDAPHNIIEVDRRIHFLLHYLLWRMMPDGHPWRRKMAYAFNQMRRVGKTSLLYKNHREEHSRNVSEQKTGNGYCKGLLTAHHPESGETRRFKETIPDGWVAGFSESYKSKIASRIMITNNEAERWHDKNSAMPEGWRIGRSDSTRLKMSLSSKGNKSNTGKRFTRSAETKMKLKELAIRRCASGQHSTKSKHHYHNPSTKKRIYAESCPEGFVVGWPNS